LRQGFAAQDLSAQGHQRAAKFGVAQVQADDLARVLDQADLHRGFAARGKAHSHFLDQPFVDQTGDDLGDRCAGEPGDA
jgi:hypothetical protein